jgi:transcription termination factor Rho
MKIGFKFEEELACYPNERIHMVKGDGADSVTAKYFEWVFPLARGQRGCIFSAPKAGKSRILLDIVTALKGNDQNLEVLALLVDQPPEGVYAFHNQISSENLLYTTYDDEAERQVFVADFMLKRAKRMAELGKDVVLLIDSLSALARVYNETEYSLGGRTLSGDLESKTVHYIKKYLGSARCFQTAGSLTIIAAVACDTGSPFDTILASELVNISNLDVWLNEKAAVKRIYPAMDMQKSSVKYSETLMTDVDEEKRRAVWGKISELDAESLREILVQSSTFDELSSKL